MCPVVDINRLRSSVKIMVIVRAMVIVRVRATVSIRVTVRATVSIRVTVRVKPTVRVITQLGLLLLPARVRHRSIKSQGNHEDRRALASSCFRLRSSFSVCKRAFCL